MENTYGISMYEFEREIQAYCPLGKDFYTCNVLVLFAPRNTLFDFCVVDKFIQSLGGSEVIIEELVAKVFDFIKEYDPRDLTVSGIAKSNTHFPVKVTKIMR